MRKHFIAAIIVASASACQSNPFSAGPPRGTRDVAGGPVRLAEPLSERMASSTQEITDLPVPEGFTFSDDESFRNHTNFQASRLLYERVSALNDLEPLVEFYERELPRFGWKVRFVFGDRTRHIIADKDNRSCELVLARKFRESKTILVFKHSAIDES